MKQFLTGFLCGAVVALLVAAGGALFVTESPVPFMSKVQSSSTEYVQDALKGRSSDPNEKLYAPGTTPKPASAQASSPAASAKAPAPSRPAQDDQAADKQLADNNAAAPTTVQPQTPDFFVLVGAYKTPDEAETIRAQIAFSGLDSSVSHGNDGRYRVRIGPFHSEGDARKAQSTLRANDIPGQIIH